MQKLCCVHTRQQPSASLDYFVTSLPPYLHQFSTNFGGNCIRGAKPSEGMGLKTLAQGTTLATQGVQSEQNAIPGRDGKLFMKVQCYKCNCYGHYSSHCPDAANKEDRESAQQHLTASFLFTQCAKGMQQQQDHLPWLWVLLDNQSTVDVLSNKDLLKDVYKADTTLDIHCNAGVSSMDLKGKLQGYREVWYHPSGIDNILSLSKVQEQY